MKIAQAVFTQDAERGGGSIRYAKALGGALEARGHDILWWSPDQVPGFQPWGRAARSFPALDAYHPGMRRAFGAWLADHRPEVVHLHTPQWMSAAVVAADADAGVPLVATLHDGWWFCHQVFFVRAWSREPCEGPGLIKCVFCLERGGAARVLGRFLRNAVSVPARRMALARMARSVSRFHAPAAFIRDHAVRAGIPPDRIRMIPLGLPDCGVLSAVASPREAARPVRAVALCGRRWRKGYEVLRRALAGFNPGELLVDVWGADGPAADGGGLPPAMRWRGWLAREDFPGVLSQADFVVVPSIVAEVFPLTVGEALAARRPVLASRVGGMPEMLGPNAEAWTFSPGDPDALAQALRRAMEASLTGGGWQAIPSPPDMTAHAAAMEGLYEEVKQSDQ